MVEGWEKRAKASVISASSAAVMLFSFASLERRGAVLVLAAGPEAGCLRLGG